jgi:hypothetical protein
MPVASLQIHGVPGVSRYAQHRKLRQYHIRVHRLRFSSTATPSGRLKAFAACSQEEETKRIRQDKGTKQERPDDPFANLNEYSDSLFGKTLIAYFTHKISQEVGVFSASLQR